MTKKPEAVIPLQEVAQRIFLIRGHRVILGAHLGELYGVETRALNQAVKRNIDRFPGDFMFQLSETEADWLVSQNVIPHKKYFGGTLPYAFTEQGVAMLSSVLKSKKAVAVNIEIMRAFVQIRELALTNKVILQKLDALEKKYASHDAKIETIFEAIKELMTAPAKPVRRIGFSPPGSGGEPTARKKT